MKIIHIALFTFFFIGCGGTKAGYEGDGETNAQVRGNDLSTETRVIMNSAIRHEPGVVHLKSIGVDNRTEQATEKAKINAIKAVLFEGIPGSNVANPLVNQAVKEKHKSFFNKFLQPHGDYSQYIVNTRLDPEERVKVKGGIRIGIDIAINYSQLQKRLEHENIISGFGIK